MGNSDKIRVRFAPSPTGYLHVGGLRTALYNFLFARKNNGVFILRVEDTDRSRYVEGAVENLIATLKWCGLEYDEGPTKGGPNGPYIQSERLDIYHDNIKQLVTNERAYYCFCTPERLNELRDHQQKSGEQTKYDKRCLSLPWGKVEQNLHASIPHVVRLNVEPNQTIVVDDFIRGRVEFDSNLLDDQVLIKSDGYPTYHFAVVVDDHLMQISHVIRGEEWLPSTPKHVLLYKAFEWQLPTFAHLPLLLNPDRSKLSKRQGDVTVEDYRAKGYLPEALVNFVALLGWNPGTEQEFFTLTDLVKHFSLEQINKAGAVFNIEKLNWLNFEHLRAKTDSDIIGMLRDELNRSHYRASDFSDDYLSKVIEAMRPRVSFVKEIIEKASYFFEPPSEYDPDVIRKHWRAETPDQMRTLMKNFSRLENPRKEDFEHALQETAKDIGIGNGKLIHAARLAVSGVGGGPGLYDILYILGKEETIRRLATSITKIRTDSVVSK